MSLNSRDVQSPLALAETGVSIQWRNRLTPALCPVRLAPFYLCSPVHHLYPPTIIFQAPVHRRGAQRTGTTLPQALRVLRESFRQRERILPEFRARVQGKQFLDQALSLRRKREVPQDLRLRIELLINCWASTSSERTAALAASGLPAQIAS